MVDDKRIRTVIVDDQDDVRLLMRMIVEAADRRFLVCEASSGPELLEMLERKRPDAVVLDVMMPGMDGLETAQRVREAFPDVKILFCSAHIEELGQDVAAFRDEVWLSKDDVALLPSTIETLVA